MFLKGLNDEGHEGKHFFCVLWPIRGSGLCSFGYSDLAVGTYVLIRVTRLLFAS